MCFTAAVNPSRGGSLEDTAYRSYRRRSGEEAVLERRQKRRQIAASIEFFSRKEMRSSSRAHHQHLVRLQGQYAPSPHPTCNNVNCDHKCLPFSTKCRRRILKSSFMYTVYQTLLQALSLSLYYFHTRTHTILDCRCIYITRHMFRSEATSVHFLHVHLPLRQPVCQSYTSLPHSSSLRRPLRHCPLSPSLPHSRREASRNRRRKERRKRY